MWFPAVPRLEGHTPGAGRSAAPAKPELSPEIALSQKSKTIVRSSFSVPLFRKDLEISSQKSESQPRRSGSISLSI
jgi:hypothetical protein